MENDNPTILEVSSKKDENYHVVIGSSCLPTELEKFLWNNNISKCYLISDSNVSKCYFADIERLFAAMQKKNNLIKLIGSHILEPGEKSKTLLNAENIISELLSLNFPRDGLIINLGGGMVSDIGGFVASLYMRGIKYLNIPTSLLAMVDASLGGKTSVNHKFGKNLIGTFYNPAQVIIDFSLLATLDKEEYLAAIAEIIKYALTINKEFFLWLKEEENAKKLLIRNSEAIKYVIEKCCSLKQSLVQLDKLDTGKRRLLNFGHTVGHAIEKFFSYTILHGEAVALGMRAEAYISYVRNHLSEAEYTEIIQQLEKYKMPSNLNLASEELIKICHHLSIDKKNTSHTMNMVMLNSIGTSFISNYDKEDVLQALIHINKD